MQVRRRGLVLDPYVGTGSILVAAAARGAYTMGSDIDVRVLKQGKKCSRTGKQVDIYSNYEQYGLQYPVGLVRMDVHTPPFREGLGEVGVLCASGRPLMVLQADVTECARLHHT